MKVVIAISSGTEDPTRATLGILAAKVAVDQGHEVIVWLQGEAAVIANKNVYGLMLGNNMPPMNDAVNALLAKNVPFWVCEACGKSRNVSSENWVETASYKTMPEYMTAALSSDKNLHF